MVNISDKFIDLLVYTSRGTSKIIKLKAFGGSQRISYSGNLDLIKTTIYSEGATKVEPPVMLSHHTDINRRSLNECANWLEHGTGNPMLIFTCAGEEEPFIICLPNPHDIAIPKPKDNNISITKIQ